MKPIILYLSIPLIFSSCSTTSHINTMINEPAFTKTKEVYGAGAIGLEHFEVQAGASVTNHIGVVGNLYRAPKGVNIYEAGANFYAPILKESSTFLSLTTGVGKGSYNGQYSFSQPYEHTTITVNSSYTTQFVQLSLIFNETKKGNNFKTALTFKYEQLSFPNYELQVNHGEGQFYYTYEVKMTAHNKLATQIRPAIVHYFNTNKSRINFQIQYGRNIMKGFMADKVEPVSGSHYRTATSIDYDNMKHGLTRKYFLNLVLGIRI